MAFETVMLDCANEASRLSNLADATERAKWQSMRETMALARAGNYARLIEAMDYKDHDKQVMCALLLCAGKGNIEAQDVLSTLAWCWADHNTDDAEE